MFPLTASGMIGLRGERANPTMLIHAIETQLGRCKPTSLRVQGQTLRFEAGALRPVLSTNLLVPITRGTVEVTEQNGRLVATYRLWFNETVVAGSLISLFFAHASRAVGSGFTSNRLVTFVFFWLFFVGGNYVISVARFRGLLKRAGTLLLAGSDSHDALSTNR